MSRCYRDSQLPNFERAIECVDGLSAICLRDADPEEHFCRLWFSSLTMSLRAGLRDDESLEPSHYLYALTSVRNLLPQRYFMVDLDSAQQRGKISRILADCGDLMDGVVVEDKVGAKLNSLVASAKNQFLADIDEYCERLASIRSARPRLDVYARMEGLILGLTGEQLFSRIERIAKIGVSGFVIHFNRADSGPLETFLLQYRDRIPGELILIPSSYPMSETRMRELGVNVVIYANQFTCFTLRDVATLYRSIRAEGGCTALRDQMVDAREIIL